ncbi:hypothetical protein OH76DRAFT_155531 [Lentinus brumalis]|uniref:Fungal-type protein kinase domain-containing protein n=1 Tax=Lentinus brumalis TaxID=2498619 RepID=A0A371DIM0_9APHY|nr:hypothetical protein OH76DRAFT_155531 [Polyporus brumalis]
MTLWDDPLQDMFVPTILATGDVFSIPNAASLHSEASGTAGCFESSTTGPRPSDMDLRQRTVTQDLVKDSRLAPRIHHRLGLAEICSSLRDFVGPYELLVAVYTAIQAHQYAYEQCRLLHQDISVGNILLYERPNAPAGARRIGLLSDWDLAETREQIEKPKGTQHFISGTWQFMSAVLQYMYDKPHELSDDLESFLHVLNWCALKYFPHSLSADKDGLASYFVTIYNTVELRRVGTNAMVPRETCTYEKFSRVRHGYSFVDGLPPSHPFTKVLNRLSKLCQRHYATLPIPPPSTLPNLVHRSVVEVPAKELPGARNRQTVVPPPRPPAQAVPDEPEATDIDSPLTSHAAFLAVFEELLHHTKWEGQESVLGKTDDQVPYYTMLRSLRTSDMCSTGRVAQTQA